MVGMGLPYFVTSPVYEMGSGSQNGVLGWDFD